MVEPPERQQILREIARSGREIRVREFIAFWGARGRGSQVTSAIADELRSLGVTTVPSFTYGSLDSVVRIVPIEARPIVATPDGIGPSRTFDSMPGSQTVDETPSESLVIGQIPSSRLELTTVNPEQDLGVAQTLMIRFDYSQLPVVQGDQLKGVVTWESIADRALKSRVTRVDECLRWPRTVRLDDDLLTSIPTIIEAGYVLTLDEDHRLAGIVTTSDLATQFDNLARPFLVIGECERDLRRLLDREFPAEQLLKAAQFKPKAGVTGAAAMTIGDIKHFLAMETVWEQLGWRIPRNSFLEWLDELRQLRNEVAHFNQDSEEIQPRLAQVRTLAKWLKTA